MYRTVVLLLVVVVLLQGAQAMAGKWDQQWKQVDEAVNKGLPKTAIERLDPIIQGAMKEKAYPEAIKAIAKKIALEGNIQGNKPEEKIARLEAEIAKAPKEMAPVMNAILADWYWQLLPAESLAIHAADRNGRPAEQGFHHLGPAAAVRRDRPAVRQGARAGGGAQGDPGGPVRRPFAEGHGAGHLAADALRLPRPPGVGVLRLGRAGGGQAGGCLRACRPKARSSLRPRSS